MVKLKDLTQKERRELAEAQLAVAYPRAKLVEVWPKNGGGFWVEAVTPRLGGSSIFNIELKEPTAQTKKEERV